MMPSRVAFGVFLAFVAAAPLFLSDFYVVLMNYIALATMVALGLVLLTGVAGVMSFGQQVFAGIAAYTTAVLTAHYGASPWLGLALGLLLVAAASLFLGAITLRLSGHYLPISTLAWGISIYFLFGNMELLGKHSGVADLPFVSLLGLRLDTATKTYYLSWCVALLLLVMSSNLLDSRSGRAIRAMRHRATMAESFGISTAHLKTVAFFCAAIFAALAGWLYAHFLRFVSPSAFSVNAGIEYLFMAVIGGALNVWGAVIGASIVVILKEALRGLLPEGFSATGNYEIVVFGVLMLFLLHRAPAGLVPLFARWTRGPRRTPTVPEEAAPLPRRQQPASGTPLLSVENVSKRFGGLVAVDKVSFEVRAGEIFGLIGPNGAGKSTMFNLVSGVLPADSGEIFLQGVRIDRLPSREVSRLGMARTFQHANLVGSMSVLENVALGAHVRGSQGVLRSMIRADRAEERKLLADAHRQIERVGLGEHLNDTAASLPLGKQRLVEVARAMCADPLLLLVDEPAAGLRFGEKQALAKVFDRLRGEGVSILLVEHDMDFLMGLVDRLVVMQFGSRIAEGLPREIQSNPVVIEAYLGGID